MDQLLSKYQCGIRNGFSAQHCLLAMLVWSGWKQKWKNVFGASIRTLYHDSESMSFLGPKMWSMKLNDEIKNNLL